MIKEKLFKTDISSGTYQEFVDDIAHLPDRKRSSYVCFANVHMITKCYQNERFNQIINGADIVAPDGKPISIFMNIFNHAHQEKVSGPDIFPDLLRKAAELNKTVFFYGSTESVLRKMTKRALDEYPSLRISGFYSPPFRELSREEDNQIISKINAYKPDLMFVGLGCPKQETWMAEHVGKINSCMLGIGQAFQIFAGDLKRAPRWMQRSGLEWAYRLSCEPARLWKRYTYTNALFLLIAFKHLLLSIAKMRSI